MSRSQLKNNWKRKQAYERYAYMHDVGQRNPHCLEEEHSVNVRAAEDSALPQCTAPTSIVGLVVMMSKVSAGYRSRAIARAQDAAWSAPYGQRHCPRLVERGAAQANPPHRQHWHRPVDDRYVQGG